jgi:hypothetical protein
MAMSTFWRYIRIQLFVLLCGIVGPIFLAIYFMAGPDPMLEWMFWTGLLITAADVLIALGITAFGAHSAAKTAELEARGVLALAQVTAIHETNTRINDQPLVTLDLAITGPGLAPFTAQDRVVASVSRLGTIANRKLVVIVDPATNEFQIDWDRSALVGGLMPATFTLSEDNQTYDLTGQSGPLLEIMQILKTHGIGMNNMVDLRANPAARQQVQAIVRRAAVQQMPAPAAMFPSAPMSPPTGPSTAQRLQELETLRATGAITDDEYTAKRRQIIEAL